MYCRIACRTRCRRTGGKGKQMSSKKTKRDLFAEVSEGFKALSQARAGKRTHMAASKAVLAIRVALRHEKVLP